MPAALALVIFLGLPNVLQAIIGADGEVHLYRRPRHLRQPIVRMLNAQRVNAPKDFDALTAMLSAGSIPDMKKVISGDMNMPDDIKDGIKGAIPGSGTRVIDGINFMRAEICSKMIGKHQDDFRAYEKCRDFMEDICRPGKDFMMNGGRNEHTTGEGWCDAFFPPLKKKEEEQPEEKEEKHESSYDQSVGKILGKPLEGHPEELDPHSAEALCEELGDECAGYTCDKHGKTCTVRGAGTLKDSHHGEVSYVKPDFDPEAHEEEEEEKEEEEESDSSDLGKYSRQPGKTLGEPISGHTKERGVKASHRACEELGDKCAGFTCDEAEKVCTLRGPGDLVSSDNGEVSYVKDTGNGESDGKGESSSGGGSGGEGVIAHMDESIGVASQGFQGHKVAHDDGETYTGDWIKEFGPSQRGDKSIRDICKDHPNNGWCKRHGYYHSGAKAASLQLAPFLTAVMLFAVW